MKWIRRSVLHWHKKWTSHTSHLFTAFLVGQMYLSPLTQCGFIPQNFIDWFRQVFYSRRRLIQLQTNGKGREGSFARLKIARINRIGSTVDLHTYSVSGPPILLLPLIATRLAVIALTMYYFLLFIFVTANLVASTVVQDSFNGLSERSDFQLPQNDLTIASQDSPENLLTLDGSNDGTNLFIDGGNDNLFADSNGAADSLSSLGGLGADSFDLAEASPACHSEADGGQSLSKLRARDGVCSTNGQPSSDISDFIDNALGIFSNPFDNKGDDTQRALSTTKQPDTFCERRFPNRLCCEIEGEPGITSLVIYPPGASLPTVYKTFDKCQTRMFHHLK